MLRNSIIFLAAILFAFLNNASADVSPSTAAKPVAPDQKAPAGAESSKAQNRQLSYYPPQPQTQAQGYGVPVPYLPQPNLGGVYVPTVNSVECTAGACMKPSFLDNLINNLVTWSSFPIIGPVAKFFHTILTPLSNFFRSS